MHRRRTLLGLAVAGLLATLAVAACTFCPQPDCPDTLTIRVATPLPDQYTIELELDGVPMTIACDLDGEEPEVTAEPRVVDCGRENVVIHSAPEEVTIRFTDDVGTLLGGAKLEPDYEDNVTPYGCPENCQVASEEVVTVRAVGR